jgi:hypothetical protein
MHLDTKTLGGHSDHEIPYTLQLHCQTSDACTGEVASETGADAKDMVGVNMQPLPRTLASKPRDFETR